MSFPGLVACVWLTYFLSLVHYSTIPTQVKFFISINGTAEGKKLLHYTDSGQHVHLSQKKYNMQAVAIFQHSFSGTVVGAIGECPVSKNPENYILHLLS